MSCNAFMQGNVVLITCEFRDVDGNLADPTVVVLRVKDPNGDVLDGDTDGDDDIVIVKTYTGIYTAEIGADIAGTYYIRWEGSGAVVSASESYFIVSSDTFS